MKRVQAQKPFIYYETLKQWEIITVVIYALITVVIVCSPFILSIKAMQNSIIAYSVSLQLFAYFFLYVSLRNFTIYLIWLCFGIVHFVLFFWFKGDSGLNEGMANPSVTLVNTLPLLLLFQLLRFVSIKMQRREFVSPAKGGGRDLLENKTVTDIDFLIFIIYLGSWLGLSMFSVCYIN